MVMLYLTNLHILWMNHHTWIELYLYSGHLSYILQKIKIHKKYEFSAFFPQFEINGREREKWIYIYIYIYIYI